MASSSSFLTTGFSWTLEWSLADSLSPLFVDISDCGGLMPKQTLRRFWLSKLRRISTNLAPFAIGMAILGQGCHSVRSHSAAGDYVAQISGTTPSGWRVSTSNDVITLRREIPVWIMGYISRPPQFGTKEEFFKKDGQEIHYELRLRFAPLLSRSSYESMRAARAQAAARLQQGASGKNERAELKKHFEDCQIPLYFTEHNSIF